MANKIDNRRFLEQADPIISKQALTDHFNGALSSSLDRAHRHHLLESMHAAFNKDLYQHNKQQLLTCPFLALKDKPSIQLMLQDSLKVERLNLRCIEGQESSFLNQWSSWVLKQKPKIECLLPVNFCAANNKPEDPDPTHSHRPR